MDTNQKTRPASTQNRSPVKKRKKKTLLQQVSDIVFEKSGIRLEPEVRIW